MSRAKEGVRRATTLLRLADLFEAADPSKLVGVELWRRWCDQLAATTLDAGMAQLGERTDFDLIDLPNESLSSWLDGFPFDEAPPTVRKSIVCLVAALATGRTGPLPQIDNDLVHRLFSMSPRAVFSTVTPLWPSWTRALAADPATDCQIGVVAESLGLSWPSNRFDERLSKYLGYSPEEILKLRGIGRKKTRTIILVAAHQALLLIDGAPTSDDAPANEPTEVRAPDHLDTVEAILEHALTAGPTRDADVLRRRFGFAPEIDDAGEKLEEIGRDIGVTRERVRQIQVRALKRLQVNERLVARLRACVEAEAGRIWEALLGEEDAVRREEDSSVLLRRLPPEFRLAFEVLGLSVERWLEDNAEQVGDGWHRSGTDRYLLERLIHALEHNNDFPYPMELDVVAQQLSATKEQVRLAANLTKRIAVYQGYVWRGRLGERGRRAIWLHRILAAHRDEPAVPTHELRRIHNTLRPRAEASYRDCEIVLGRHPHLFVPMGVGAWRAAGGKPLVRFAAIGDEQDSQEETPSTAAETETAVTAIAEVLRTRGPMFMGELKAHGENETRYSAATTPVIVITSGQFLRLAPGLYGLATDLEDPERVAHAQQRLLRATACTKFVRARYAGEPMGAYPLWNTQMERLWCEWGESSLDEETFRSLLAVAEPDRWDAPPEVRERWTARKRASQRYGLDEGLSIPEDDGLIELSELLGPLIQTAYGESVGWTQLNRIAGKRLNDRRALAILAILAAMGAVESATDFRRAHGRGRAARDLADSLIHDLHVRGRISWEGAAGQHILRRVHEGFSSGLPPWLDPDSIEQLRRRLPMGRSATSAMLTSAAEAIMQLGIAVALSDNVLHPAEVGQIKEYSQHRLLQLTDGERSSIGELLARAEAGDVEIRVLARELASKLSEAERRDLMKHLFEIATADDLFCEEEALVVQQVQSILKIDPDYFEALYREAGRDPREAADLLAGDLDTTQQTTPPDLDELVALVTLR